MVLRLFKGLLEFALELLRLDLLLFRALSKQGLAALSFLPCVWIVLVTFAACLFGTEASLATALGRTAAVALGWLPVLLWFRRGSRRGV